MRIFICLLFSTILLACANQPSGNSKTDSTAVPIELDESASQNQITCWGIGEIELEDTFSAIEEKVGKDNISTDSLFLEGMFEQLITTLWKGDEKEIIIHWKEKKPPFKTIDFLEISNNQSPYHFNNGIKIGTKLTEVERLNGKPFNLYGFGWDYGGTFVDFGKGKLADDIPCFGGVFQLQTDTYTDVADLLGDQKISSSHPSFKTYDAVLKVIRVSRDAN